MCFANRGHPGVMWCCSSVRSVSQPYVLRSWRSRAGDVEESHRCRKEFGKDSYHPECCLLGPFLRTDSNLTSCFESGSRETDRQVFCSILMELFLEAFHVHDLLGWRWGAVAHTCVYVLRRHRSPSLMPPSRVGPWKSSGFSGVIWWMWIF